MLEKGMESFVARLTAERDALQVDHDALRNKTWAYAETPPPPFEDVVAALERDPIAAATTYGPIRDRIVARKAEHAADALRLRGLEAELAKLRADIKEHGATVRKVAKERAVAAHIPQYEGWTAVELKDKAADLHSRLKQEMFGREYKFGGYIRDETKIEGMNNELDAVDRLLSTRHGVQTSYADNRIAFAEKDSGEIAGAKRLKRD